MKRVYTKSKTPKCPQSGQVSLLMVSSLIPTMMLVAFVINIGLLVNAKINLQNAADSAAYAGAAAQARTLTRISHLNYGLRQNYKKFIFKYYVLGNMGQKCFPGIPGRGGPGCNTTTDRDGNYLFLNPPSGGQNDGFPLFPAVCAYVNENENPCQFNGTANRSLALADIPCLPGTPDCAILNNMIRNIRNLQERACESSTLMNRNLVQAWLYNTNPTGSNAGIQGLSNARIIRGLLVDIGLIPANLILSQRIETLLSYINEPGSQKVTPQNLTALNNVADLGVKERTILAFRSAQGMLSGSGYDGETWGSFDPSTLQMDELLTPSGSKMLDLERFSLPEWHVFSVVSETGGGSNAANNCDKTLYAEKVLANSTVVAYYRKPSNQTRVYYAVRVSAKAHILFNPFDDLTLSAYAAAVPFGSRIGPKPDVSDYLRPVASESFKRGFNPDLFALVSTGRSSNPDVPRREAVTYYPNLIFSDQGGQRIYYSDAGILENLYKAMGIGGQANLATGATTQAAQSGWETAMGPDPYEVGKYNIPIYDYTKGGRGETGTNEFNKYFDASGVYKFWAPVSRLDQNGGESINDVIQRELLRITGGNLASFANTSTTGAQASNEMVRMVTQLMAGFSDFLGAMGAPQGAIVGGTHYGGVNFAALADPLKPDLRTKIGSVRARSGPAKITDAKQLATSWWGGSNKAYEPNAGREGYSVKFVPFASIVKPGNDTLSNLPGAEIPSTTPVSPTWGPEADVDTTKIPY